MGTSPQVAHKPPLSPSIAGLMQDEISHGSRRVANSKPDPDLRVPAKKRVQLSPHCFWRKHAVSNRNNRTSLQTVLSVEPRSPALLLTFAVRNLQVETCSHGGFGSKTG